MLLFRTAKRSFASIPRILPLNSTLTRFKIWETEKSPNHGPMDKKIYSVSIETGKIYASLDQDKVSLLRKDEECEFVFFKSTFSLDEKLKSFIINEHTLNGEPNHIITLQGLKYDNIKKSLNYFLDHGHRYGSPMWKGGMNGFPVNNEKNISQLLTNVLTKSDIQSILKQPVLDTSESGIIKSLIEAEKIEKAQEDNVLRFKVS